MAEQESAGLVSFDEFKKMKLVVGEVKSVEDHPNAERLLLVKVDIGGSERTLVAGLRGHYTAEQLTGRKVVVLENIKPAKLRGVESQGMLLAAVQGKAERVWIVTLDSPDVPTGTPVS